jgi:Domain of unknown function (DUF1963)
MDADVAQRLKDRREPAIWFRHVAKSVSKSRVGGLPTLPNGIEWPVHLETEAPLHFLAQIDLSTLPATPLPGCRNQARLPREGILYFFADFDDDLGAMVWDEDEMEKGAQSLSRVIYAKAPGSDRAAPDDLPMLSHEVGELGGEFAADSNVFPVSYLQAHVIDTFQAGAYFTDDSICTGPFPNGEADEARRQSILKATGEVDPDGVSGLQMFGAASHIHVAGEEDGWGDSGHVLLF